jgi:gas vesicle protein GvpN
MLVFGDDEFKTSDLIGNQLGYTRKKVVDNFIHSVVKVEDELKQNWVDSRLTLACREGFTLVYDEFNRSRPEVNNVLLSALEEKILALPPSGNRPEYVRVNPQFRAIFTSNPEEYCGVHSTQDALMDRLITINMPEPDELTQQEILVQKTEIERESAILITQLVKAFRLKSGAEKSSGLRSGIAIAKVCQEHNIPVMAEDADFRDICMDVLLSRASLPLQESTTLLWELLNELVCREPKAIEPATTPAPTRVEYADRTVTIAATSVATELVPATIKAAEPQATTEPSAAAIAEANITDQDQLGLDEAEVYAYLRQASGARVSEIEAALSMNRFQAVNALRSLAQKGILAQRNNRLYITS